MQTGIPPAHEEVLAEYRRLRQVATKINGTLLHGIPHNVLLQYAKRLGLLRGKNTLVCDPTEADVLVDHLIFTFRRRGKTVIEEYFSKLPPEPGSDELIVLQGMMHARYSLYTVEDIVPGLAVYLSDGLRDVTVPVVDMGMSTTAWKGAAFAGRILPFSDYWMTTGALIPTPLEFGFEELMPILFKLFPEIKKGKPPHLNQANEDKLADQVVRAALKWKLLSTTQYRHGFQGED